jgi:hypothetical protein
MFDLAKMHVRHQLAYRTQKRCVIISSQNDILWHLVSLALDLNANIYDLVPIHSRVFWADIVHENLMKFVVSEEQINRNQQYGKQLQIFLFSGGKQVPTDGQNFLG